jgi:hypothetical protein
MAGLTGIIMPPRPTGGAGAVLGKMQLHLHNVLNKNQYDLLQAVIEDHQIFAWQQLSNTCSQPGDSCREFLRLFWEV